MTLDKYEHYFKNILVKAFVKSAEKRNTVLTGEEVTNVYIEQHGYDNKSYLFGKTTKYYFIMTYTHIPYEFSIALMHEDPIILLDNFEKRDVFFKGISSKDFIDKLFLMNDLENELEKKNEKPLIEINKKKFKI